jgi:hypothetical protein
VGTAASAVHAERQLGGRNVGLRVLAALFSGIVALIATTLVPVAYFGDKNKVWAGYLCVTGFVVALVLVIAIFW